MPLEIERLTADDTDDAWSLSTQAGWNQTWADWRRLVELFPETCFAGRVDGDIVATSTLATYDATVGWIGMVLVDGDHRRRGYGSEIFERALRAGLDRSLDVIGLDATDAGRAVYEQYEFDTVVGIDRWSGVVESSVDTSEVVVTERPGDATLVDAMTSFDTRRRRPTATSGAPARIGPHDRSRGRRRRRRCPWLRRRPAGANSTAGRPAGGSERCRRRAPARGRRRAGRRTPRRRRTADATDQVRVRAGRTRRETPTPPDDSRGAPVGPRRRRRRRRRRVRVGVM